MLVTFYVLRFTLYNQITKAAWRRKRTEHEVMQQPYRTVDIERRGYGRRYTWLPVDSLSREGFSIDFTDAYLRPDQIDIRLGDTVRWREGERLVQAYVADVRREPLALHVRVADATPLPPEAFHP
jgi:hypothetical protein